MNASQKVLHIILAVMASTSLCFCSASSFYITRDGAGNKNGSSLANAAACDSNPGVAQAMCAAFNNPADWGNGSNQIGPGTTVYVGGDGVPITASSGASSYFAFQGSGSNGNSIEFYLQTTVSAPYWCCSLSGGAININNQSYILIDGGGTPCGWNTATNTSEGTCAGAIQATSNGDGLTTQNDTTGIYDTSCNNVEIRNIGVYNLYVKSNLNVAPTSNAISIFVADVGTASNCSIHDNDLHDNDQLIVLSPGGSNDGPFNIYNNNLYNMNQGIIDYSAAPVTISVFNIYGNHIHDMGLWDTNGLGDPYHHDGIYLTNPNGPQTITSLNVYNNVFDGTAQQAGSPGATSWFYLDGNDTITKGYLYNNVILETTQPSNTSTGDPMINWGMNGGTVYVYNNTFICSNTNGNPGGLEIDQHSGTTHASVFNNLIVNCGRFVNLTGSPATNNPPTTGYDYNVYTTASNGNMWSPPNGCCVGSLAEWQTAINADSHALATSGSAGLGGPYENGPQSPLSGIVPQSSSIAKGRALISRRWELRC